MQQMKIKYFPWSQIVLFVFVLSIACVLLLSLNISVWFITVITLFTYFMTMRDASVIILDAEYLKIFSLNFLVGIHSISRKSIIKIHSIQTLSDDTHEVVGAPYPTMKIRYRLEYLNNSGKKVTVDFLFSMEQLQASNNTTP